MHSATWLWPNWPSSDDSFAEWTFQTLSNKIETMLRIFLILSFCLPFYLFVGSAHAQCPESNTGGIQIVENFLTEDRYADRREEHNISASVDSIRTLNEEQDLEACSHFSSMLGPGDYRKYHYYKAGDHYFILNLIRPREEWPDPEELFGPRETGHVFDQDLESVLVFFL